MLFRFECPACGGRVEADSSFAGTMAACPHCQISVGIPYSTAGPGATLGGFRIEKLLGRGGMGQVFLATQLSMERQVALKILPSGFAENEGAVARFLHEVRNSARLNHPNIVVAHEAGEDDGIYYLAMAFVEGESLVVRLARDGALPEAEALRVVRTVAEALDYAWEEHQFLRRDIKPANIMIDRGGRVQFMDLGLSRSPLCHRLPRAHRPCCRAGRKPGPRLSWPCWRVVPRPRSSADVRHTATRGRN